MFHIPVTLKYGQGHWKGYKLNAYYCYAKFDFYHIYGVVSGKKKILITSFQLAQTLEQPETCQLSPLNIQQSGTNHIMHDLFNVCMFKVESTRI